VSGSGISWAICKSAPRSRQITMPVPHHSVFLQAGCPSCYPTNSVKALKAKTNIKTLKLSDKAHTAKLNCHRTLPMLCLRKKRVVLFFQQVCVEPDMSAINMTLPTSAAECWAPAALRLSARTSCQSPACRALSSKPAACCCGSMEQTDG